MLTGPAKTARQSMSGRQGTLHLMDRQCGQSRQCRYAGLALLRGQSRPAFPDWCGGQVWRASRADVSWLASTPCRARSCRSSMQDGLPGEAFRWNTSSGFSVTHIESTHSVQFSSCERPLVRLWNFKELKVLPRLPCSETSSRVVRQASAVFSDKFTRVLRQGVPCSGTRSTVLSDTLRAFFASELGRLHVLNY